MSDVKERKFKGGQQHIWDATSISAFLICERKWHLMNFVRPDLPVYPGVGRKEYGSIVHDCLDAYYRAGGSLKAAFKRAGKYVELKDGRSNVRSYEGLFLLLALYHVKYRHEPATTLIHDGELFSEKRIEIPWLGTRFSGYFDLAETHQGKIRIVDHKVTSADITGAGAMRYFQLFKPDIQTYLYTVMGRILWGDDFDCLVINAIRPMSGGAQFSRHEVRYTPSELEEFTNLTRRVLRAAETLTNSEVIPYRPTGCGLYGGCDYLPICQFPPEARG